MNKSDTYARLLFDYASLSRCAVKKSSSLITMNGEIVAFGVNGAPRKSLNCDEIFSHDDTEGHDEFSRLWELDSSTNAIVRAMKVVGSLDGAQLWTMYCPAPEEIKFIRSVGINTIRYILPGDVDIDTSIGLCGHMGINIEQIDGGE